MKKLFYFISFLSFVSVSYAQDSLFPKLNFEEDKAEVKNEPTFVKVEEKAVEETQEEIKVPESASLNTPEVVQPKEEKQVVEVKEEEIEEEEEDEGETNEKVYIALDKIKTTVTTVRAVSYCSGYFTLDNTFKKRPLEELSVSVKIGNTEQKFNFNNVPPQEKREKRFIMVGEDCAEITKVPPVDIEKCKIKGISSKKCKEKIEFIPIPQQFI